ncbi:hypothetical protein ACFQVD_26720 [Streptosporangium amethystogenes subsp. fukuiense]|uniref:Uncharacterized protein n=1 Tax=Streptosporangium amethystogenes subsp. fukuiense TaxID=698418 RepID=A0ABW2T4Z7_9ACTN
MTNPPNLDEDTRKAVAALASRVRNRDAAEGDREAPELFANEFVQALRGQGWRPTAARPALRWSSPRSRGADPSRHAEALAEARARCADGAAKLKASEVATVDALFGEVDQ